MSSLTLYPYQDLGHADHGWLNARHHFSFARYWNPARVHFGELRVINDDIVAAGRGFAPHAHDNMEIITYVRSGAITHRDSMGNEGKTGAGDVQVMSAGSGVTHSEMNSENVDTILYQIWIESHTRDVTPRWEAKSFPKDMVENTLHLLVSGQPEHQDKGALFIYQDAAIYGGKIAKGSVLQQTVKHNAYVLASMGTFSITLPDGKTITLNKGDGAEIVEAPTFTITALDDAEVIVIDVPSEQ